MAESPSSLCVVSTYLWLYLFRLGVAQRQNGESRGEVGVALSEDLVTGVNPTSIGALALLEGLEQFLFPIVLFAGAILERVFAERGHGFGEGVIIVVKPCLLHARILVQRVLLANARDGDLNSRVFRGDAGVEKAFQAGVSHAADGTQAAFGRLVLFVVRVQRVVDEAAFIVIRRFLGEGLIVLFAGEILASA